MNTYEFRNRLRKVADFIRFPADQQIPELIQHSFNAEITETLQAVKEALRSAAQRLEEIAAREKLPVDGEK